MDAKNPLPTLPIGPRSLAAHAEGSRTLLATVHNRAITVGAPFGHGPAFCVSIDENSSMRIVAETLDAGDEVKGTALAVMTGKRYDNHSTSSSNDGKGNNDDVTSFLLAEGNDFNVGLFQIKGLNEMILAGVVFKASALVTALALTIDDKYL